METAALEVPRFLTQERRGLIVAAGLSKLGRPKQRDGF